MIGLVIILIATVIVPFIPFMLYNSLVGKRNQILNVFGTMDAMLKKRWDLVPNLVSTVKGYAQHERQLLEQVTQTRTKAMGGQMNPGQMVQYDNTVSKLIGLFYVTVENYPQLKAGENFLHLQRTLNELEEQISAARRAYNASVTDYNNAVGMFPTNIIASLFNFQRQSLLEFSEQDRQVPVARDLLK